MAQPRRRLQYPNIMTHRLSFRLRVVARDELEAIEPLPLINGQSLLEQQFAGSVLDVDALDASAAASGSYLIFTCACMIPECGGWDPVRVIHERGQIRWELSHGQSYVWSFNEAAYRAAIAELRALLAEVEDHRSACGGVPGSRGTGLPIVCWAARNGRSKLLAALLEGGASPETCGREGRRALHEAIASGNEGLARLLLAAGADPNRADHLGQTPLHIACEQPNPALVDLLLDAGADPNLAEGKTLTAPLHIAARFAPPAAIALLLAAGADPNQRDREGWTALDWLLHEREAEEAGKALLLGAGATAKDATSRLRDRFGQ